MISVIVPIYNKEQYLKRCIISLINQTYNDLEILLINDGSTDNSLEICKSFLYDNRIRIINKNNEGVSSARNCGLQCANGNKIMFVDADDYISLDYIKMLNSYNEDLIISGYMTDDGEKSYQSEAYDILFNNKEETMQNIFNKKFIKLMVVPYLKLFKREIIIKHDIKFNINISFGEDTCFVLDYINYCCSVRFINEVGYYNVITKNSLSRKYVQDIYTQLNYINDKVKRFQNKYNDKDINYWIFRNVKVALYNEKDRKFDDFKKSLEIWSNNENCIIGNPSGFDKILIFMLNKKMYICIYFIYHYIRR